MKKNQNCEKSQLHFLFCGIFFIFLAILCLHLTNFCFRHNKSELCDINSELREKKSFFYISWWKQASIQIAQSYTYSCFKMIPISFPPSHTVLPAVSFWQCNAQLNWCAHAQKLMNTYVEVDDCDSLCIFSKHWAKAPDISCLIISCTDILIIQNTNTVQHKCHTGTQIN